MKHKVIIKVDDVDKEAFLVKDEHFWGGWKVEYENSSTSIRLINIVDDFGFSEYKKTEKKLNMKEQIEFTEFLEIEKKLEIKYGTITEVEKMEGSDKMLKLQVDFGDETRTILTNIGNRLDRVQYLVGTQFPFITNLKPKKMMGVESHGMIMICEDEQGNIQWPKVGFKNGSRLL